MAVYLYEYILHVYIAHTYMEMCAPHLFCFSGEDRLIQLSLNINSLLPLSKKKKKKPFVLVLSSVLDTCFKGATSHPRQVLIGLSQSPCPVSSASNQSIH